MNQSDDTKPTPVATTPQQAGDAQAPWGWVERSVWTERMLTRLTSGESANRVWFRLWDKTYAPANLASAFHKVWQNGGSAGADAQTVAHFARHAEEELSRLAEQMSHGTYRPQPVRRAWIPKPGSIEKRPLGIPAVRDRIVQGALRHVLEPIFEAEFAGHSYGFRPGRGAKDALRRVDTLLKTGHDWVVDADLKSYFDTIPHERLLALVNERVADGRVLALVESFLRAGLLEQAKGWQPTERGTPQGGVISPLLANLYLSPLDQQMEKAGLEIVRYADDFVILCRSAAEAQDALAAVRPWVSEAGLTLHPEKTRVVDARAPGGFDVLGYHFERGMKWPRPKSLAKLKERVRAKTGSSGGFVLLVGRVDWRGEPEFALACLRRAGGLRLCPHRVSPGDGRVSSDRGLPVAGVSALPRAGDHPQGQALPAHPDRAHRAQARASGDRSAAMSVSAMRAGV